MMHEISELRQQYRVGDGSNNSIDWAEQNADRRTDSIDAPLDRFWQTTLMLEYLPDLVKEHLNLQQRQTAMNTRVKIMHD